MLLAAAAITALLLTLGAHRALAESPGSLTQLAPPNDCIQQTPAEEQRPECGSSEDGLSGTTDVVVSPDGQNVYVLSSNDDSIAEFQRNGDGSLTPLAAPNSCIAQAGQSSCGNDTAQGLYDPQAIAISPDGKNVYVVGEDEPGNEYGEGGNGAIAVFDRNADGSLTQRAPDDCISENSDESERSSTCASQTGHGIQFPVALAVSPDGNSVYVADYDGSAVAWFTRNGNGSLSQPDGSNDCLVDQAYDDNSDCANSAYGLGDEGTTGVVVSPDGSNVYTAGSSNGDNEPGVIATFARNPGDGSLSQPGGPANNGNPNDCIEGPGSDEGCNNTGDGIVGFTGLAVSPDGQNVYSASEYQDDGPIAEFARNPDGSLTQLASPNNCIQEVNNDANFGCGTSATGIGDGYLLKVSPDGASVYTAAENGDDSDVCSSYDGCSDVAEFSRNAATGALAQLASPDDCIQEVNEDNDECGNEAGTGLGGPGLAISPDNNNVYVTGENDIAEFSRTPVQYQLTVTPNGSGSGSVTDDQGGISCPPTCSHNYTEGTQVTLTAHPAAGSAFTGWSGGGCSGTDTCTVYMNQDQQVTATFTSTRTLNVSENGSGSGTVTDDQGGISCPSTCSHAYPEGTQVTLHANPDNGSYFAGWSGAGCSGNSTCTVTMNQDQDVTATFQTLPGPGPAAEPGPAAPGGPGSPSITSDAPTVHGDNGAGVSGSVNPEGSPTSVFWQYGLDKRYTKAGGTGAQYTNVTPTQQVGSDSSNHAVSTSIGGLLPNALYHVRMVAFNSDGTAYGADFTFTTQNGPPPSVPVLGKSFNVTPVSGTVFIVIGLRLIPLTADTQIPAGSLLDMLHGSISMNTASTKKHKLFHGIFGGAVIRLTQATTGPDKALNTLALIEGTNQGAPSYKSCKVRSAADGSATAHAALSSRVLQTLRARSSGSFRTRGRYAAGTVRGTQWTTTDSCGGTLIAVQVHSVNVWDYKKRKVFVISAGHSYLATP